MVTGSPYFLPVKNRAKDIRHKNAFCVIYEDIKEAVNVLLNNV